MGKVSLVSISCLTFNHAPYLRKCFDSFLAQKTDFDIEILVHDDASSDGTQEIIQEYTEKYPGIFKPIIQKENQYSKGVRGIAVRYNFARSKGKYIATCEGDDYWTDPLKLQKQVDFLEDNPNYSMCCTNYSEINSAGEIIKEKGWGSTKSAKTITQEVIFKKYKPKILTSVFRKESVDFEFPKEFFESFNADNFMCALASNYGPIAYLNIITGHYRVHNQGIWSGKSKIRQFEMQLETFVKMKNVFLKKEQQLAIENRIYHIRRKLSRLYILNKDFGKSFSLIHQLSKTNKIDSAKVFFGNLISIVR